MRNHRHFGAIILIIDNYDFGVAAVDASGNESPVVFPVPQR